MFFDHYPYTNFHNINLDWVLQAVKAWGQTVEANDRAFRDLKEANEDFKRYVTNYLQDLDITDEINTKLDAMLASGVLTPYFAPYVQGYVNSWLNSHVTPTSPALDNTLTLSGAAARADSTGHRLKDLAYIDALSTPEIIAALNRSQVLPGYRVQGIAYDYNGHYYVCGGSVDETGTGVIVKMTKPDFTDAEITEIPQLGHANDITYYDGYLYVCTVGGGDAPRWGIYKINVNDFTDKTLISNAPENTIGISYRRGDFWILAPYRIYRTTDFTSYEVVVANTNDLLTAYGIPTDGRISQTIFRAAGYLIGWVCSFVFEDRHYGALTFFNSTGEPVAFKMFPAYHSEIQGAVYADMSIYLVTDGNMVNVFRMDPRHLSYVQLKAGDDLNSFTGRGTLYSTGSNVSAELLNSPSAGEGFTVQVDRLGVYNTIQTARTNSGRGMYRIKSFNSDTWGEWIEPAAEVAQIKEDLTNVYEVVGSTNIYNPALPTTTGWLTNTGAVDATGTGANFSTTDFIPVAKNTDYIVKNVRVGYASQSISSRILVALYDANKSYISGTFQNVVGASPMQVAVSSGNASYLRVSTLPTHLASEPQYGTFAMMVVVSGTDVSQYIPFTPTVYENRLQIVSGYGAVTEAEYNADMFDVDERIENVKTAISGVSKVEYSKNIYDRTTQLTTGWLTNTGTVDATGTGANFATTDFIKIDKNTDYIIANERMNIVGRAAGSRILMALYDANHTYITNSFQNVVNLSPMKVTFNSGDAKYLRVSTLPMHMGIPTSEFALIVQKGSELDGYTTYWVRNVSTLYPQDNILFGKKYVACGDSLTAGDFTGYTDESGKTGILSDAFSPEYGSYKTYPYWIASRNGMTLVNSGINGSTMAISKEYIDGTESSISYRSPFSYQRYKDIPNDADYITIWFGVNDSSHTYLGTIDDTTNETFYGAWNVVLPYLVEHHPNAKIGIIITFGIPDSPYTVAVREVAKKWGIPFYDFAQGIQSPIIIRNKDTGYAVDSSMVDMRLTQFRVAVDNNHPNLSAHKFESTCLEAWLRSL